LARDGLSGGVVPRASGRSAPGWHPRQHGDEVRHPADGQPEAAFRAAGRAPRWGVRGVPGNA